jgi:hypothetical protein
LSNGSRYSSVSIVSAYGLDDRVIDVRSPAEARDFSSNLCVQNGTGDHPASCTMGTGVLSLGVKRGRGVTLTTHPHLVPPVPIGQEAGWAPEPVWRQRLEEKSFALTGDRTPIARSSSL